MAIRYWLGVVQRDHVRDAVRLGIGQLNHGDHDDIARLGVADGLVYYSPRETRNGTPLRAFTAIGRVADADVYPADAARRAHVGQWRRRIDWYRPAVEAPVRPLRSHLEFTRSSRTWGMQLRRGVLELSRHDWDIIREAMRMPAPEDRRFASLAADVLPERPRTVEWF